MPKVHKPFLHRKMGQKEGIRMFCHCQDIFFSIPHTIIQKIIHQYQLKVRRAEKKTQTNALI